MADDDIEQAADTAAAAGQVPAEAVAVAHKAARAFLRSSPGASLQHPALILAILAAAVPLIVADRQDVEQCDHCGEEKRVAWWYENGEAAVCGECHEAELLERDKLRAEVDRLTAERDAALAEVSRLHEAIADGVDRNWRDGLDTPGGPQ